MSKEGAARWFCHRIAPSDRDPLVPISGRAERTAMNFGIQSTDVISDLIDREDAARLLGVAARTLDRWHIERVGPPRVQLGRKVRYRRSSLESWVRSREVAAPQST